MRKTVVTAIVAAGAMLWISPAFAAILYSQTDSSQFYSQAENGSNGLVQELGTGLNGAVGRIDMYLSLDIYLTSGIDILQCDNGDYVSNSAHVCTNFVHHGATANLATTTAYWMTGTKQLNQFVMTPFNFDATKYYYIIFPTGNGVVTAVWGSQTNTYSNGSCLSYAFLVAGTLCTGVADSNFIIYDQAGVPILGDKTYIKSIIPSDLATTSNPVTLSSVIHVGTVDLVASSSVYVEFDIASVSQGGLLTNPAVLQQKVYSTYLSTAGDNTVSTSIGGLSAEYEMWVKVYGSSGYLDASTTAFTVGTSTAWGQLQLYQFQNQQAVTSALTATTTNGYAAQCSLMLGFGQAFQDCMTYLWIPNWTAIGDSAKQLVNTILHIWPIGYMTLVEQDIQGANTAGDVSSLPALNLTLPTGYPGAGTSFDLTPWDKLLGAGTKLSTATNPNTGHTIKDIVQPTWNDAVYALWLFVIFSEILRMRPWDMELEEYEMSRRRKRAGI